MSPLSVYSALSLALAGSESETREELVSVLGLAPGKDIDTIVKSLGEDLQAVADGDAKKTLVEANGVFIQAGSRIRETYTSAVSKHLKAGMKQVTALFPADNVVFQLDFGGDCEGSRVSINRWIAEKTREKIKDLLAQGSITPMTHVVLANAVYFKGVWKCKFEKSKTDRNGVFHSLESGDVRVSMMTQKASYPMADFVDLEVRALKVPFETHEMVIVLPEKNDGLPNLLKQLSANAKHLEEMLTSDQYFDTEVVLKLPRFSLGGHNMKLKEPLHRMGLKSAFDAERADFSGITSDRSLAVSDVYHQAVIDVDEEGAEAAAATAMPMMVRCMPAPPVDFIVDHPFIFFIVTKTGIPVFMGHVVHPESK
ncbi:serine protease inhibitor [Echinococcus granulosus]|uniref:Serine protease inhibitor n=1 Tax=Echinococcus granulosus TaxID=6210 RepID=W6V6R7_ECHGR|nr:serine protease inhibitor [Echinococcus granulosus]EUB62104.1 serine protease inhibitor [Echinococcus granulosus]